MSPPTFEGVKDPYCSKEWFRPSTFIRKECFLKRDNLENERAIIIGEINSKIQEKNFKIINESLDPYCNKNLCQASGYRDRNHLLDDFAIEVIKNIN